MTPPFGFVMENGNGPLVPILYYCILYSIKVTT